MGRVRDASLEAFAHDDAPFERVVAAIQPERDTSVTPLFQALFVLQNAPSDAVRTAGVHFEAVPVDRGTAQLDLTLELSPGAQGGLDGRLEVSGDLFDRASTERLAAHYARLLAAVLREPDRPVDEIDLVGAEERRVLVDEWNATEHAFSRDACMHELFEAQVDRAPDAEALAYEGERLTYRALDERANRLAHRLEALGVGPDVRVAICVERSIDMVVAIYSVLKAGGAYVPLDPEDPPERLGYVIDDARVRVAIVQQQHDHAVARAAPDVARFVIDAPESARALASEAKDRPRSGVSPRNLVYVLYTSGSTGRPKGVLVEHRGVVNRIEWMQHAMRFGPGDAVLQKTPLTFDVAGWELYLPLVSGARLVVAAPKRHGDPAYLSDAIVTDRITAIHFVPSMLGAFLSSGDLARCESLARVFSSGEALPAALVRAFHDRLDAELYNLYGPTEASIDVSAWRCDRDQSGAVPIGRPIWNTQLDVLDDDMAPVPIGLPGELFIGGVQLARAYGGRPSLTADKLVPDPFGREDGARLYRTGDLARFRRDGSLEFLGRIDQQVKLRGFRIELGEIESVLVSHGAIRQAVVVLRGTEADARLVAYVVPNGAAAPSTAELSLFAQNRLPAHMVPSAFVVLDALPLTPSGKVRRAALPEPDRRSSVGYVAPRSETEQTVATLFSELLGVERVGVDDDFFALGGHSLLAVMAVARVKSAFGVDLPLVSLFESRTVAAFALRIVQARATDVEENVLRALLDEIERSPH